MRGGYIYIHSICICIYIIWMFGKRQHRALYVHHCSFSSSTCPVFVRRPICPHDLLSVSCPPCCEMIQCVGLSHQPHTGLMYSLLPCWWIDEYVWVDISGRHSPLTSTIFISVPSSSLLLFLSLIFVSSPLVFRWWGACVCVCARVCVSAFFFWGNKAECLWSISPLKCHQTHDAQAMAL